MASITLYELSNYNNALLISRTFDLDGMQSQEDWIESVTKWLERLTLETGDLCEEWIVADYEDVPAAFVGQWDIDPDYWNYKQVAASSYLDEEVFIASSELDIQPGMVEELYQGQYDSVEDFAYQLADDLGLIPEEYSWPASYIDWERAARDLMMNYGESGRHYFRTSY